MVYCPGKLIVLSSRCACEARVSLSVFSLAPDLLFDCSCELAYAKIRTVLQFIKFTHYCLKQTM